MTLNIPAVNEFTLKQSGNLVDCLEPTVDLIFKVHTPSL